VSNRSREQQNRGDRGSFQMQGSRKLKHRQQERIQRKKVLEVKNSFVNVF
jgi:hypothetical protein